MEHESGWTLIADEDGLVIWENAESEGEARYIGGVDLDRILGLWIKLSEGRIAEIEDENWLPGEGRRPASEEERGR